jgi:hypothetical protein
MPPTEDSNILHLLVSLKDQEQAQHTSIQGTELEPGLARLRAWQSQRLSRTYADFLDNKQFGPACRFFQTDIYAPRDFSQRDHDLERLYHLLSCCLPGHMLRLMRQVIALNALTNTLDRAMLTALVEELGAGESISTEQYAQAYIICNQYPERKEQIDLLLSVISEVLKGARFPLTGPTLKLARGPALAAGWIELYSYLERAYAAFRPIRTPQVFLSAVEQREMRILDRIFAGHPHPFEPSNQTGLS